MRKSSFLAVLIMIDFAADGTIKRLEYKYPCD